MFRRSCTGIFSVVRKCTKWSLASSCVWIRTICMVLDSLMKMSLNHCFNPDRALFLSRVMAFSFPVSEVVAACNFMVNRIVVTFCAALVQIRLRDLGIHSIPRKAVYPAFRPFHTRYDLRDCPFVSIHLASNRIDFITRQIYT
jgi:hypothetical protein